MVAEREVESAAGGRSRGRDLSFEVDVGGQRMMRGEGRGRVVQSRSGGVLGWWAIIGIGTALLPVMIALVIMASAHVSVANAERLAVVQKSFSNGRDRESETAIPTAKWGEKGDVEAAQGLWKKSARWMSQELRRRSLRGDIGGGDGGGGSGKRGVVGDAKTRGALREVHVEDREALVRGLRVMRSDERGERKRRRRRKLRFSKVGIRALQVSPDPSQTAAEQARTAPIGQRIETPDGQGGTVVAVRLNAGDFAKTGYTFNEYRIPAGTAIQGSPGEVVLVYHKKVSSDGTTTTVTVNAYAASNVDAGKPGTQIGIAAPSTSPIIVKVVTSDPSQVVTCPGGGTPLPGGGGCQVESLDGTVIVAPPPSAPATLPPPPSAPATLPPPSAPATLPVPSEIPPSQPLPSLPVPSASTPTLSASLPLPSSLSPSLPPSSAPPSVPESILPSSVPPSSVPVSTPPSSIAPSSAPPSTPSSIFSSAPPSSISPISSSEPLISSSEPPISSSEPLISSLPPISSSLPPISSSVSPISSSLSPISSSESPVSSEAPFSSAIASLAIPSSSKPPSAPSSSSSPSSDEAVDSASPSFPKDGVLVPASNEPASQSPPTDGSTDNWRVIVGATVGGVLGAIVIVGLLLAATRLQRENKISKMNQATDKGETLQTALVGASRAPAAPNVRTRAHLETDEF